MAAAKPMDWILDLRTRGHGVVGLGLQWIQERETISYHVANHMDQILDFRV
jgi:hypothetical protein